ncbi:MAG: Hsp20 family protein [Desulfatibacillum sp.]|nr:Hsp20 family protein [Desulfatibacillum sp.]
MQLEKKYSMAKLGMAVLLVICVGLGVSLLRDKKDSTTLDVWKSASGTKSFESFPKSFAKEFKQGQNHAFDMLDKYFDDSFFKGYGKPFEEMEKMREELMNQMEKGMQGSFDNSWDDWYNSRFSGGGSISLNMEETAHSYVYRITIPNREEQSLKVDVSKDGIKIEGKLNRKVVKTDGDGNVVSRQQVQSSVSQHFSLPSNADYAKAAITNSEDEIVIKIPKI